MSSARIQILTSDRIDKVAWNTCIEQSSNGSLFALFEYLNAMAPNWSGLIVDNYKIVMPLIWQKKMGIKYLCALPFVRQLGMIGNEEWDISPVLQEVHKVFRYGDILFNFKNTSVENDLISRTNYVVSLDRPYCAIYEGYQKQLKRKLAKLKLAPLVMLAATFDEVILAYEKLAKRKFTNDFTDDFRLLQKLSTADFAKKYFTPYKVLDENNVVQLLGMYAKDDKRIYDFMATNVHQGKEKHAMLFAIDTIIQKYAERALLFDFMGSDISGVKKFNENFSPINQPYFQYHFNRLPWPIKFLKK